MITRSSFGSPLGRISLAGFVEDGVGVPGRPWRVLGSYALVFVLDGGGRYEDANGLSLRLTAGDLLLVFPDLPHSYGKEGSMIWSEFYLVFDGPIFDLWRAHGLLDPARPVHRLEPVLYWRQRLAAVLSPTPQPGLAPALGEICKLQELLAEAISGRASGPDRDDERSWLTQACALLETDLEREPDLAAVATAMSMSYEGFRKRFRRAMRISPARYRGIRRMDRACELMQQGTLTDRQIAEHLGFCDEYHFSHRFKEITGSSPRQWRGRLPRLS